MSPNAVAQFVEICVIYVTIFGALLYFSFTSYDINAGYIGIVAKVGEGLFLTNKALIKHLIAIR